MKLSIVFSMLFLLVLFDCNGQSTSPTDTSAPKIRKPPVKVKPAHQNKNNDISVFLRFTLPAASRQKSDNTNFRLTNLDSLGRANWHSENIEIIDIIDDSILFIKCQIPDSVTQNSSKMWCRPTGDSMSGNLKYGAQLRNMIELTVASVPKGADAFLIPIRIWEKLSQGNPNWYKNESDTWKYRVADRTNVPALIDQTNYVVLCKYSNSFKYVLHTTAPYSVQKKQTATVYFP